MAFEIGPVRLIKEAGKIVAFTHYLLG